MSARVAIVDLGTNTFHVLVAEVDGLEYSFIHRERIHVALGKDGINSRVINQGAASRAFAAARHIKEVISRYSVEKKICVATSALRNSRNANEIIAEISRISGLQIEVISGDKEADYIFQGIAFGLNLNERKSLIMDIGGGSVEFIITSFENISWKKSFEIGAQRLTDKFHFNDPIKPDEIKAIEEFLSKELNSLFKILQFYKPVTLIGSSGTFDTFSEIYRKKNKITLLPGQVELPLTLEAIRSIHEEIIRKNRNHRMEIPGMVEMRVDLIVAASILIQSIMAMNTFNAVRVSSFSLKEGIFSEFLKSQKYLV